MVTPPLQRNFKEYPMLIQVIIHNSVLSEPKKKAHYDKYGTVDEDNFNFEDFMKNFQFDFMADLFDDPLFAKKGFFDNFMGGGAFDGRHNIKLMYIRKKAYNIPLKKSHIEDHEHEVY
jgi:DnaJ-class molecular chaperone